MNLKKWQKFLSTLHIADEDRISPATEADVRKFEEKFSLPLPVSYREFVKVLGGGVLGKTARIRSPYFRKKNFDLADELAWYRKGTKTPSFQRLISAKVWPTLIRLIPFSSTDRGDRYIWDPEDVTVPKDHEYGVYFQLHQEDDEKPQKVTDTFAEFVERLCAGDPAILYPWDKKIKINPATGWPEGWEGEDDTKPDWMEFSPFY